jgi:dynactin-4
LISATGSWPDSDNANSTRVAALLEHYRSLAQLDKFEKEQKRQLKRRSNYLSFTAVSVVIYLCFYSYI